MTNGDKIRTMSNDEIAEVLVGLIMELEHPKADVYCPIGPSCKFRVDGEGCDPFLSSILPCHKMILDWLNDKENIKALLEKEDD